MESKCHNFLVRQKFISFLNICIIHTIYIYVYTSFSTMLDKVLRKNIKKQKERERWISWKI